MAAKKSKQIRGSARARGLRTLQHQTLPPETRYGIDTEVWFRGLAVENAPAAERPRGWPTKDQVHDEAIAWFLERHATRAYPQYPARRAADEDLTFWVDSKLMERARRMAQRDGVKVARLIDAALSSYVKQCVADELISFRQRIQDEACRLYLRCGARRKRVKASAGRSSES